MINTKVQLYPLVLLSCLALFLVAPSHLTLFTWDGQTLAEASTLPSGSIIPAVLTADLDNIGQPETVAMKEGKVEIISDGSSLWSSPADWEVVQAEITDLNHDGNPEVTLLVWRAFKSWPIDAYLPHPGRIQDFHDRVYRSCHLILIGWSQGSYRELWAGSALADPLSAFTPIDINQDGQQELAALESHYNASWMATRSITVWEWNGFGFTLLARGPKGTFHSLAAVRTFDGQELLLVQGILRR
jgi:hypothetical protein